MLCFVPINSLALGTLPADRLKNASGLYNLMRNLGGAIGLAAINTVLIERLALHESRLSDHLTLTSPRVQQALETIGARIGGDPGGDASLPAMKLLWRLMERQAHVLTFSDCLLLMACVFFGAVFLMPLIHKPRPFTARAH